MIKIGIIGHSPEHFSNIKSVCYDIENAIKIIERQHNKEKDIRFLLNCEPGIGQWFCNIVIENSLPYEVYLTSTPEKSSLYWTDEQTNCFNDQINKSKAVHTNNAESNHQSCINRDIKLIKDSQWLLFFWNGKHQGLTYEAIKYAVMSNKMVYNGLGELKLVDKEILQIKE